MNARSYFSISEICLYSMNNLSTFKLLSKEEYIEKFIASYKGTNYPYTFHASEPQKEMREDARFSFDNKN